MNASAKTQVFKKIFAYHSIQDSQALNAVWEEDFQRYSSLQIQSAWDKWRKQPLNFKRKPKSAELLAIIQRGSEPNGIKPIYDISNQDAKFKKGRSITEDEMIKRLYQLKQNNPNYLHEVKQAATPKEKMAICAMGLNMNLSANWLAKSLISKLDQAQI